MGTIRKGEGSASRVVSFRLDASHAARLDEAASRLVMSPGDVARRALLASLEGNERTALHRVVDEIQRAQLRNESTAGDLALAVEKVQRELAAGHRRLSASVQMLLVNGGKLTPEQARRFARENLIGASDEDQP